MLDIFQTDAFGVVRLTAAINNLAYVPGRIGEMGLFTPTPIDTTQAAIERQGDSLVLVPPTQRGMPGTTTTDPKRDLRSFVVPHFEINDVLRADEVQNLRAFGEESALDTVTAKVAGKLARHTRSMSVTEEQARLGAVKGVITYADGSTLNLFTEFGVSQASTVFFNTVASSPTAGDLREKCDEIDRAIAEELGGLPYTRIHAFCGKGFWQKLIKHKEVREVYLAQQGLAERLLDGKAYGNLRIGNITFEEYRGSTSLSVSISSEECHIFPVGVPDLFQSIYAPADYMETVNTLGRRMYSKQYQMANGKGIHLDTQMNALQLCTRPKVLIKGSSAAS